MVRSAWLAGWLAGWRAAGGGRRAATGSREKKVRGRGKNWKKSGVVEGFYTALARILPPGVRFLTAFQMVRAPDISKSVLVM
jgi:hypothetical protein